jgi:hypothetical protein
VRYHIEQRDAVLILDALDFAISEGTSDEEKKFTAARERFLAQHPELGDTQENDVG